ncbi:MAG: ABC transporter ATP-binding protein [Candidatus Bathyarchaeota archaeon]|nr:ABC transporter ATP-binding protein [Candidatus Bathyarchaeota archaeon]
MQVVVANNLCKSYGGLKAVNNLNLAINEGTITGLIGSNGAGKTTTIKMILGILKPTSGKVEVFDQNPWDNLNIRPLIGIVHEKAFFPAHQKTQDYLERTCRIFGVSEMRALEVLKLIGLEDARSRPIKALSAGMLQKFAIAHALIHKPRFIIGDEMTANLDPQARSSLFKLILSLNKEDKITFLISSHILPELSQICDSVVVMNRGEALANGKLEELYQKFATSVVRISTDEPEKLAEELRSLDYVEKADTDIRGISVQIQPGKEQTFYEDAAKLAIKIKVRISGIDNRNSMDELYNKIVGNSQMGKT